MSEEKELNIFHLDKNPKQTAMQHCDKHVVKMILETAQMLCTAYQKHFGEDKELYKTAFPNHPMTLWVGESLSNYMWSMVLLNNLLFEYNYRYNKVHKTKEIYKKLVDRVGNILKIDDSKGLTIPPLCMPDKYKNGNYINSYRDYYKSEKKQFAKYTNREIPSWLV